MTAIWLVKLFAAPVLIGLASLAGRRWGPNIAGLLGGLPLVGGPVILALWLSGDSGHTILAAQAAPAGVWANIVYMLAVGHLSARFNWMLAIPVGWACYLLAALLLNASGYAHSLILGIAVLPALWFSATRWLPRPQAMPAIVALPRSELALRILAAAALVLSLTTASGLIGPSLTGILSGAPVAAVVIPAFTFAKSGRDALLLALRGFLIGLMGFVVFFLCLGQTLSTWGLLAFMPAAIAAVVVAGLATRQIRRRPW